MLRCVLLIGRVALARLARDERVDVERAERVVQPIGEGVRLGLLGGLRGRLGRRRLEPRGPCVKQLVDRRARLAELRERGGGGGVARLLLEMGKQLGQREQVNWPRARRGVVRALDWWQLLDRRDDVGVVDERDDHAPDLLQAASAVAHAGRAPGGGGQLDLERDGLAGVRPALGDDLLGALLEFYVRLAPKVLVERDASGEAQDRRRPAALGTPVWLPLPVWHVLLDCLDGHCVVLELPYDAAANQIQVDVLLALENVAAAGGQRRGRGRRRRRCQLGENELTCHYGIVLEEAPLL